MSKKKKGGGEHNKGMLNMRIESEGRKGGSWRESGWGGGRVGGYCFVHLEFAVYCERMCFFNLFLKTFKLREVFISSVNEFQYFGP